MFNIVSHWKNEIRTTMRYHYTPIIRVKIKITITIVDEDVEQLEFSYIVGGNAKLYSHFGKQLDSFL